MHSSLTCTRTFSWWSNKQWWWYVEGKRKCHNSTNM